MIVSILITAFSLVLLVYWFRYSCILLVRSSREGISTAPVTDPRFAFPQAQLDLAVKADLRRVYLSLDRDFQLLKYLVEHAAGLRFESVDDRLLMLDYKVMRLWYRFARILAPERARAALVEMATVLNILVCHMSDRAGVSAEV